LETSGFRKKETAERSDSGLDLGAQEVKAASVLAVCGHDRAGTGIRAVILGTFLGRDKMATISRAKTRLRTQARRREYKLSRSELLYLTSARKYRRKYRRQARTSMQYPAPACAIALDKIRPLSHLHSPRLLLGSGALRLGHDEPIPSPCAMQPSRATVKQISRPKIGRFAGIQG
jgi:hypothetical protein